MTDSLASDLVDAGRLLRKRFDAAARHHNVTGTQWRVLFSVHREPGINQGQLAEQLEVEPITTCRMVDRLEQAGLVERRRNPEDRRAWSIYLTQAALPLIDAVRDIGAEVIGHALGDLTPQEIETLGGLLARVRASLLDDTIFAALEQRLG